MLLTAALLLQTGAGIAGAHTIAIDRRLADDAGLRVGDTILVAAEPTTAVPDTMVIAAIHDRFADPAEVARDEYLVTLHLGDLQRLLKYGDRVDRFAIATRDEASTERALATINGAAFGFQAHRSREIAVETSRTFQVVSRFHRAIAVISVVASAIFLLCILLLKVDERRRDVAALRLIGISRSTVLRAVLLEAAVIALAGSLLGALIGRAATALVNAHYQEVYRTPLRFAMATPGILAFAVGLSIVLGILAGALAARRLVRSPPLALFGR